jgi:hypothetical protein
VHTPAPRQKKKADAALPAKAVKPRSAPLEIEVRGALSQRDAVRVAVAQGPGDVETVLARAVKHNDSLSRNLITTVLGQLKLTGEIEKGDDGMWSATEDMKRPDLGKVTVG